MLQIIIEVEPGKKRFPVTIQETMSVEALISWFVRSCGCPLLTEQGLPVRYQLRPASTPVPLPSTLPLLEAGIRQGSAFILEALPMATPPPQLSRRTLVRTIALASLLGFGSGGLTALVQAYAQSASQASTTRQLLAGGTWRSAVSQLTFSSHQAPIRTIAWNNTGLRLASGGEDHRVLIWDTNGTVQQTLLHQAKVETLAWAPAGDRIVTGAANQITFFSTFSGQQLAGVQIDTAPITSLAWAGAGAQQVVSGSADHLALVWDTTTYQVSLRFGKHTTAITGVSWEMNGKTIASTSQGGIVRIWDAASGQELHPPYQDTQAPMHAIAFAPKSTTLAVGGDDGIIHLWQTGISCQQLTTPPNSIICVDQPARLHSTHGSIAALAWSPDSTYLASGHADGFVSVWKPGPQGQPPLFSFSVQPHAAVTSLSWSPLGNQLATAASNLGVLWQLQS